MRGDDTTAPRVPVCGLPGSGNRLLVAFAAHHGFRSHMHHGDASWTPSWIKNAHLVLVPVRHLAHQEASALANPERKHPVAEYLDHHRQVFRLCLEHEAPFRLVSYEALVEDPEGMGRELAGCLGVEYRGWPEDVYNANAERSASA